MFILHIHIFFLILQIKAPLRWHWDKFSSSVTSYYFRICMGFWAFWYVSYFPVNEALVSHTLVTVVIYLRYCRVLLPLLATLKLWLYVPHYFSLLLTVVSVGTIPNTLSSTWEMLGIWVWAEVKISEDHYSPSLQTRTLWFRWFCSDHVASCGKRDWLLFFLPLFQAK